ncbi:MAG: recombinase family protein [Ruminococcus sp.]|nr:recombinase family protein [Ruminococcus sp.]
MAQSIITPSKENVTVIMPTISRFTDAPLISDIKRKVAAYARVSTDHEEQQSSYEAQVDYYTNYIKAHPDWDFAGIYADSGITGCNTTKREAFKTMIADALAGKINLIITKSVSRFARNTVDSLQNIRTLKEHGVEVYFEKENIWTFDSRGELLISLMSSIAQEEARSISENCTWGQRKRFADGKVTVPFKRFLGYDRGENGELVINEEQAVIVRRIYALFLQGKTPYGIAKILTSESIPTPGGKAKWGSRTIESILTNEKYKGDALLQKVFTTDFLTKKKRKNEGQVPQYYVAGDHPAIIEPEIFDQVQLMMEVRKQNPGQSSSVSIFSGKIVCGDCGGFYGSKVWHSRDKYRRVIWRCNRKYSGDCKCGTPHLTGEQITAAFLNAFNAIFTERDEVFNSFEMIKNELYDVTVLTSQQEALQAELNEINNAVEQMIAENARKVQDQDEYNRKRTALIERYEQVKAKLDMVNAELIETLARKSAVEQFLKELRGKEHPVTEFSDELWLHTVQSVKVMNSGELIFVFKDGTEVKV